MTDPVSFPNVTSRHQLPVLFPGQAQKEFTVNEALARIDALLHPVVSGQVAAPPSGAVARDCVLVASGASGAFAGHDHALAFFDGQQWTFLAPTSGMMVEDRSTGQQLRFNGTWQSAAAPQLPSGGNTIDTEARQAITELVAALRTIGIFSPT